MCVNLAEEKSRTVLILLLPVLFIITECYVYKLAVAFLFLCYLIMFLLQFFSEGKGPYILLITCQTDIKQTVLNVFGWPITIPITVTIQPPLSVGSKTNSIPIKYSSQSYKINRNQFSQ